MPCCLDGQFGFSPFCEQLCQFPVGGSVIGIVFKCCVEIGFSLGRLKHDAVFNSAPIVELGACLTGVDAQGEARNHFLGIVMCGQAWQEDGAAEVMKNYSRCHFEEQRDEAIPLAWRKRLLIFLL